MDDILTHLQWNLMSEDNYSDDARTAREEAMERRVLKRSHESPGMPNPMESKRQALGRMELQETVQSDKSEY